MISWEYWPKRTPLAILLAVKLSTDLLRIQLKCLEGLSVRSINLIIEDATITNILIICLPSHVARGESKIRAAITVTSWLRIIKTFLAWNTFTFYKAGFQLFLRMLFGS